MDEKGFSSSYTVGSEKQDGLYPMCFGVSCAYFALNFLSGPNKEDERWSELHDKMVRGGAQLLGLLFCTVQRGAANEVKKELLHKLEIADREIEELKKRRSEDAKANEKVVGIFAAQEQSWFNERKKLRQQIGALVNTLRVTEKKMDEAVSEFDEKLKSMELLVKSKDKALGEEERRKNELEEKLAKAENVAEELRETTKRKSQEHSTEIWKHKTAFIELVSNQRQIEAEMDRAVRQAEATKQELDSVLEQKVESVLLAQNLSMEIVKMSKDLEQKDKILSAMLRKCKSDTVDKQMLLKEVKLSKAKRKQAELETERWKAVSESRHEKHSLRSMFTNQPNSRVDVSSVAGGPSHTGKSRSLEFVLEYDHPDSTKDPEVFSPFSDYCIPETNDKILTANVKRLEGWVRLEAEKYATAIEKRHHLELEAFAEQMRLKDEKLEAFRWQLLSMELETKRLQSHVEGLNQNILELKHDNMKLEAILMEREEELNGLKEQFASQLRSWNSRKTINNSSLCDLALSHRAVWSNVKIIKRKPVLEEEQETETIWTKKSLEEDTEKKEETEKSEVVCLTFQSPAKELEGEKDGNKQDPIQEGSVSPLVVDPVEKSTSCSQPLNQMNNNQWRMDLHALGVSYKIKRLKQQLERVKREQESGEDTDSKDKEIKGFLSLMTLLNKQVSRYHSLQGKLDDLCKRMHENDVDMRDSDSARKKSSESKLREHFLEETFQLQRYVVAIGQKMLEVESKIGFEFVQELDKSASFDLTLFADNVRSLFQDVQRGLELRIARIIGDLHTLACEGMMINLRR
ncbi:hypothetical protein CFOL_v3_09695 [Cephalotus follicularis]|uniref:Uncharacterized protein n=1 Tax=Cephalotus follicularis TaxID=3775 RepID=A0A1Q3BE43_CEPFO|nr:hypothetical protein CFOL_v3_09695 [Cephalotus follicularis]